MKNVTISMNDELLREARIEAAKAGMSTSRFLSRLIDRGLQDVRNEASQEEKRKRLEALERFMAGPKLKISENGRMPTAEERNARR